MAANYEKYQATITLILCTLLGISCIPCTSDPAPQETTPKVDETTTASDETTPAEDYGTLAIDDAFAWVGYLESVIIPAFSIEEYREELTYEYDTAALTINAKTNTVKALKTGRYVRKNQSRLNTK